MLALQRQIGLLETVFSGSRKPEWQAVSDKTLPLWLSRSVDMILVRFNSENRVMLVTPRGDFEFDQLAAIQRQIERKLEIPTLLVVDDFNPKYRALFVRNKIPFIYKGESLFAPGLGVKLFDQKVAQRKEATRELVSDLSPFELKILSGYLTGFFNLKKFNLDVFFEELKKCGAAYSKMKIAQAINHLLEKKYVFKEGKGPFRSLTFMDRPALWEQIQGDQVRKTHRLLETYLKFDSENAIWTNETALAKFSSLVEPSVVMIAFSNKEYHALKERQEKMKGNKAKVFIQIRRESPQLFSVKGCLNPVEIYFDMKNHHDERVQIALGEMLQAYDLKVAE